MMGEEQAVLGLNRAFYRAFEKKDLDTMSALWSHGSASRCIHPGRDVLKGWKVIYSSWEKIFR
ncbi:MAG: nuclear transport factor 2 family protein, partial [Gloeobacterales cyanobacterium]